MIHHLKCDIQVQNNQRLEHTLLISPRNSARDEFAVVRGCLEQRPRLPKKHSGSNTTTLSKIMNFNELDI